MRKTGNAWTAKAHLEGARSKDISFRRSFVQTVNSKERVDNGSHATRHLFLKSFIGSRSSMPLRLDVRKKLSSRSDRVKAIDLHSSEPWICASLYNGNVHVWNIETQQLIKTFEVCAAPVRAVRFVPRKNWLVTGSDDMMLRIYNYNTLERVHQFEAHSDYIRSIAVHPTQPFILTSSDDMFIRLWDWEKNWACAQVFEGHTHYVMQLVINPKDNNTFATGSLDKTVKVLHEEVKESVKTGCWFGDAFLFTNTANRLLYFVGGELVTVAHLDRPMYLLGYLASENRVFLSDRDLNVVGFTLLLSVLEYETAVLRGDFAVADSILPSIPPSHRTKIAHFLERQGFRQQAMRVTTDPDHKFDLALQLNDLTTAHDLIKDDEDVDSNESKWRQLADLAVKECDFKLAQECFSKTRDYASFLLIATSAGDAEQLEELSRVTAKEEMDNLAFLSLFLLNNLEGCLQLLVKAQRYPEAAIFARTYLPSKVPEMVELWRKWLSEDPKLNKAAEALANPQQYPNLFPGWEAALHTEKWLQADRERQRHLPASAYPSQPALWDRRPAEEMQKSPFPSAPAVHVEHKPVFQPPAPAPVQPDDVQVKSQSDHEPLHQPVIAPHPAKTHQEQPTRDPIADLLSLSALNSETTVTATTEAPTKVFEAFPGATFPADNESAFDPFEMTAGPPATLTAEPSLSPASLKPQAPQTFDTDLFDFKAPPVTQAAAESPLSHYEHHPQQGKQSPGVQHLQKTAEEEEEEDFGLELERQLASLNVAPSSGATHTGAPPKSVAADLEWGDEDDFEDPEEA
nr:unnamed protein product [Spirometra erinaceieuropaei]